jgi:hypothetical protein
MARPVTVELSAVTHLASAGVALLHRLADPGYTWLPHLARSPTRS